MSVADGASFPVETKRLRLRRLTATDLADFQSYRNDPNVSQFQGWNATSDEDALRFLIENGSARFFAVGKWFQIGIALRDSDRLIGDIGICRHDESTAEIGFSLSADFQRQGFATEAISKTLEVIFDAGVEQIHAVTDARNTACIALLEKLELTKAESVETEFENNPCVEHRYIAYRTGI